VQHLPHSVQVNRLPSSSSSNGVGGGGGCGKGGGVACCRSDLELLLALLHGIRRVLEAVRQVMARARPQKAAFPAANN
jgi:hypothetical protein